MSLVPQSLDANGIVCWKWFAVTTRSFLSVGLPQSYTTRVAVTYNNLSPEQGRGFFSIKNGGSFVVTDNSFYIGGPDKLLAEAAAHGSGSSDGKEKPWDTGGVNALLLQSRSIVFNFNSTSLELSDGSKFILKRNFFNITGYYSSCIVRVSQDHTPTWADGREGTSLFLRDHSLFSIDSNTIHLSSIAPVTLRAFGSSSVLLISTISDDDKAKNVFLSNHSHLHVVNNRIQILAAGRWYHYSPRGVIIGLDMGSVEVQDSSSILSANPEINITSHSSMDTAHPYCPNMNRNPWPPQYEGKPNARAYTLYATTKVEQNSSIRFLDGWVWIQGFDVSYADFHLNTNTPTPGDTYMKHLLQVSGTSSIEVNPLNVTLKGSHIARGIYLGHGVVLGETDATISLGSRKHSSWNISLSSATNAKPAHALNSLNSLFIFNGPRATLDIFSHGTNLTMFAPISVEPVRLDMEGLLFGVSCIFAFQSQLNIFSTLPRDAVPYRPSLMFHNEIVGSDNAALNGITLHTDITLNVYSNLTCLVGSDVTVISPYPGSALYTQNLLFIKWGSIWAVGAGLNIRTNTVTLDSAFPPPAVLHVNSNLNLERSAIMSLTNINATGFSLLDISPSFDASSDLFRISQLSTVVIAHNSYAPIPRTSAPTAIVAAIPFLVTNRSQVYIYSNQVTGNASLLTLKGTVGVNRATMDLTFQSSILISQNVVSGFAFDCSGRWSMDKSSTFTLTDNVFTAGEKSPLLPSTSPAGSFSFNSSSVFVRCNRYFTTRRSVELFPKAQVTKGEAWASVGEIRQIGCEESCQPSGDDVENDDLAHPLLPFCSPIGAKPAFLSESSPFYDNTSFVKALNFPKMVPNFRTLATSRYVNASRSCQCTGCRGALQLSISQPLTHPRTYFEEDFTHLLEEPFCVPTLPFTVFDQQDAGFRFPTTPAPPAPPQGASSFEIGISVASSVIAVLLVAALGYAFYQRRLLSTERKRREDELEKALVSAPTLTGNAIIEWKVKPTALSFRKGKQIGSGGFGRVFIGLDNNSGRLLAAKEINLDDHPDREKQLDLLRKEIGVMKKLSHPNVVQYLGADRVNNNTPATINLATNTSEGGRTSSALGRSAADTSVPLLEAQEDPIPSLAATAATASSAQNSSSVEGEFYIFMEYLPGGSLRSLINSYGRLNQRVSAQYTRQALEGLKYLHGQSVVHRDIKAANLLIDRDGVLKIADMGCAQSMESISSVRGTPMWMAPEVILTNDKPTSQNTKGTQSDPSSSSSPSLLGAASDVWSLGCTVMEMLTGRLPFEWAGQQFAVLRAVSEGDGRINELLKNAPDEILNSELGLAFIKRCCRFDPKDRPTAEHLLSDPFVLADTEFDEDTSAASVAAGDERSSKGRGESDSLMMTGLSGFSGEGSSAEGDRTSSGGGPSGNGHSRSILLKTGQLIQQDSHTISGGVDNNGLLGNLQQCYDDDDDDAVSMATLDNNDCRRVSSSGNSRRASGTMGRKNSTTITTQSNLSSYGSGRGGNNAAINGTSRRRRSDGMVVNKLLPGMSDAQLASLTGNLLLSLQGRPMDVFFQEEEDGEEDRRREAIEEQQLSIGNSSSSSFGYKPPKM